MRSMMVLVFLALSSLISNPCVAGALPWATAATTTSGNVLLLSDLHFDPFADPKRVKDLIASPVDKWEDIFAPDLNEALAAPGMDSNYPLLISALKAAQQNGPYDLAIVTGDYLVHDSRKLFEPVGGKDEDAYENFVTKVEVFVVQEVQKQLPGTPVYFCSGNNDSECGDYMMAPHTRFLDAITDQFLTLRGKDDARKTMAAAGYYVIDHPTLPDTELIALNDIYWSNHYSLDSCHATSDDKVGEAEMDWLAAELKKARDNNKKVFLVMHIPPQLDMFSTIKSLVMVGKKKLAKLFWEGHYENDFVKLMRQYPDVVKMIFAGHTHMDDFRVMRTENGDPFLFTHICPAVSPIRYNNPGFQVVEYDKASGAIQDEATFYLSNLTTAKGAADAQWDLEYDFDSTYGVKSYDAVTLAALTQTLDHDDAKRSLYAKYYAMSAPPALPEEALYRLNDLRLLSEEKELNQAVEKIMGQGPLPGPVEAK